MARKQIDKDKKTAPKGNGKIAAFRNAIAWKGLASIEFRVFRVVFRVLFTFVFIMYLLNSLVVVPTWVRLKLARLHTPSHIEQLLDEAAETGNYSAAEAWLEFRPSAESQSIIDQLVPYSGHLSSLTFFEFSEQYAKNNNAEEADFWYIYALYRVRFDFLRCGLPDGVESGDKLLKLISTISSKYNRDVADSQIRKHVQRVLDFDAEHPAQNEPGGLCRVLSNVANSPYNPMPQDDWDSFREGLRESTRMSFEAEDRGAPMEVTVPDSEEIRALQALQRELKDNKK